MKGDRKLIWTALGIIIIFLVALLLTAFIVIKVVIGNINFG